MAERNNIAGNGAMATYGVTFLEGTIAELMAKAKRKDVYSHSWNDENGTDRELSEAYFESKSVALPCLIIGTDKTDLITKYAALIAVIKGPERFNLDAIVINRRYSMLFDSISDFKYINSTLTAATFTMNLIDDYPDTITPIS